MKKINIKTINEDEIKYGNVQNDYQQHNNSVNDQKSRIVAGVFGIVLGALGVHNFYLGYTGKAVGQLLLTLLFGYAPMSGIVFAFKEKPTNRQMFAIGLIAVAVVLLN